MVKTTSFIIQILEQKKIFFLFMWCIFSLSTLAQQDLPNPPANFQAVPAGSYVIPMDNINQSIVPAGQGSFNLKAYGLLNEFLQEGIRVKWAIRAGKERDDIDFTAVAERVAPSAIAATSIDFRGGPLIVPDTILPCGLSTAEIIAAFGNNVAVYRLTQNTTVDVRYELSHRPKIAVFNNGGNEQIHTKILDAAGVTDYEIMDAADIVNLINCYTFASEPHADEDKVSLAVVEGIRDFVMNGGNFLAQCHAIDTYENRAFFHTTSGITILNTEVTHAYPNADLAYSQIDGSTLENAGGSVTNWILAPGSEWRSNTYRSITYADTVIAMGAKLTDPGTPGGNVYYLGGHDYSKGGGKNKATPDLSTIEKINALRLYLNAAFVPSRNSNNAWANAGEPSVEIGCSDSVVLGCEPTGPPLSTFRWIPATGLSCTTCPNPVARPAETTTYVVEVTNGCIARDTIQVVVEPLPIAGFTSTTVCEGIATEFTDTSTISSFWSWDFGDPASGTGNTSSLQNPTHVFSRSGSFEVRLIAGTQPECSDTVTTTVVVNPTPLVLVNSPTICEGEDVVLTASGANSYVWSTGEITPTITVSPTTTTAYTLTGTTDLCSFDTTATVTIAPPLVPKATSKPVNCFGGNDGTASVHTLIENPDYTYSWNTDPVQTTNKAIDLIEGKYIVTVTDTNGCSDTTSVFVTEPPPLVLTTSMTDVSCKGSDDGKAQVSVSGGTAPYTYRWATSPEQTAAEATGLEANTYKVFITDVNDCMDSTTVTINEPLSDFTLDTATTPVSCFGGSDGSASLTVGGGTTPYTYLWNSSPEQLTSTATNLPAGNYLATVTDFNNCSDTIRVFISEPDSITLETSVVHPTCLIDGSISLGVNGGNPPFTYRWNTSPEQTTANVNDLTAGIYEVTVTDANSCLFIATDTLLAPSLPLADFTFTTGCVGTVTNTFTDQSTLALGNITSWAWDFGEASATSTEQNSSHIYSEAGTYPVFLTVTTDKGCEDTLTKLVEVYPIPQVDFGPPKEGCAPVCIEFKDFSTVSSGFIQSWLWTFGNSSTNESTSSQENPSHCYKTTGTYKVTLRVVSNHGCSASLTQDDLVKVHPSPQVDLGSDRIICSEESSDLPPTTLFNAGAGLSFSWQPNGETKPVITVEAPGTYSVTVSNEWGCNSDASVNVREVCPPRLFVGNAFSPDGDNINDEYTVYSVHVGAYQMLIFNRWGEIIFESLDKNKFWNGMYRGELMPIGVYPWLIIYEGDSEEYRGPYRLEGSVTVVR